MKVAIMTYSTKPRGGVVHATYLAEHLQKLGLDVKVFALASKANGKWENSFYRLLSVPYEIYPFELAVNLIEKVKLMIQTYVENLPTDFDIYHTQDCVGANALHILKSNGKIKAPTVRTIHHIDSFREKEMQKFQENSIKLCDVKITVSKYWQMELTKRYRTKFYLTYNGIDTKRFNCSGERIRNKYRINGPMILSVSGLEPRKGLEYLVLAMELVQKELPNARLVIIGRSGLRQENGLEWFQHLENRLDISNKVIHIETIEDTILPQFYAACDIFVLPSRTEGWGLSLMEAMASGKPVIATRVGGIPELIKSRRNGLLVEMGDVKGLATEILRIMRNKNLAKNIAENGKKTVAKFTWDKTARKTKAIYEVALKHRRIF